MIRDFFKNKATPNDGHETRPRRDPAMDNRNNAHADDSFPEMQSTSRQSSQPNNDPETATVREKRKEAKKAELYAQESLLALYRAYKKDYPQEARLLFEYYRTVQNETGSVVIPKTRSGKLLENVIYIDNLLRRTPLVANSKDKTIFASSGGGQIHYENGAIKFNHKDLGVSRDKNKSLFTMQDAINMALHARHRPDMLPPNSIKLTGGEHYRATLQRAIDLVNKDLPPGTRMQVSNKLSETKITHLLGPINNNDYVLMPRPTAAEAKAAREAASTQQQATEQSAPAGQTAESPKAGDDPANKDARNKSTNDATPPSKATGAQAPNAAEPTKKYTWSTLDDTLKAKAVEIARMELKKCSERQVGEMWDRQEQEHLRAAKVSKLQGMIYENIILYKDGAKSSKEIGVTIGDKRPVFEVELHYPGIPKEAATKVQYIIQDNDKPIVIHIAKNDYHPRYDNPKYKLDDKIKTDFEDGVDNTVRKGTSVMVAAPAAKPNTPPPAPGQP